MNYLLQFLLIFVMSLLGSAKVLIQGRCSRNYLSGVSDCIAYNGIFFVATALTVALLFPIGSFDLKTVLWASLAGVAALMYQVFYTLALRSGPVSLTVMLCNLNIFLPVCFCIIVYHDTIYVTHLIGIVFMILTLVFSRSSKSGEEEKKASAKWIVFLVLAFLATGLGTTIQRYFVVSVCEGDSGASVTYLLVLYIVGALLSLPVFLVLKGKEEEKAPVKWKPFLVYGALTGIVLAVFQRLNMYVTSVADGTFMLPTYSGLQTVMMTLLGVIIFRDKLSKRQLLGVAFGIACVICMNLRLWPLT